MHYHTAFVSLALAVPPLMFALSLLLIKVALHESDQSKSRYIRKLQDWGEKSYPIQASLVTFLVVIVQTGFILWSWYRANWGDIAEMGGVIRIMASSQFSPRLLSRWISGIGLLKIIPYQTPVASAAPESEAICERPSDDSDPGRPFRQSFD